jgi:serine/threonine-protein kinase RsbW
LYKVEHLIEEVCNEYNLEQNYLGCISVAVTEAFQNALIHGSKLNPTNNISIEFEKNASGLQFRISDEGDGFDYESIPDVKDDGKEKEFPGRGIFLIKSLADDVTFIGKGNILEIGFKISSINYETAVDRISKLKDYSETKQKVIR